MALLEGSRLLGAPSRVLEGPAEGARVTKASIFLGLPRADHRFGHVGTALKGRGGKNCTSSRTITEHHWRKRQYFFGPRMQF